MTKLYINLAAINAYIAKPSAGSKTEASNHPKAILLLWFLLFCVLESNFCAV